MLANTQIADGHYDIVEEVEMNDEPQKTSNQDSGSIYEKDVVQNPYYDGEEILNPADSTMNVMENPYYERMEVENNITQPQRMKNRQVFYILSLEHLLVLD